MTHILFQLRKTKRLQLTLVLGLSTCICFFMSILRMKFTGTSTFTFLNWNLFLAFLPWALTSYIMVNKKAQKNKVIRFTAFGVWLLLFPNAPYILTDLFHLKYGGHSAPIWYDLVLILSFAWTGLLFGLLSLMDIAALLRRKFKLWVVNVVASSLLFIAAFGIYLGRYLRWNSWDIVRQPSELLGDIGSLVFHPTQDPRAWGMTITLGVLLNLMYWTLKAIVSTQENRRSLSVY